MVWCRQAGSVHGAGQEVSVCGYVCGVTREPPSVVMDKELCLWCSQADSVRGAGQGSSVRGAGQGDCDYEQLCL